MFNLRVVTIAAIVVGGSFDPGLAQSPQPPQPQPRPDITRADLLRHDLDVTGRQVIQVRVGFAPGASFPPHSHPGAEIAYVLEGLLEYRLADRPPVRLEAGSSLFIPAGMVHSAANVGPGNAVELATYVVEKGVPLVALDATTAPAN